MSLYADRTQETTATTGTGTLTLAGAVSGYRAFTTSFADGDRVRYAIALGSEWEVGDGVFTASGTTLTRENVYSSSNSNALVNFSAGTKLVWSDLPAMAVMDLGLNLMFKNNAVPQ